MFFPFKLKHNDLTNACAVLVLIPWLAVAPQTGVSGPAPHLAAQRRAFRASEIVTYIPLVTGIDALSYAIAEVVYGHAGKMAADRRRATRHVPAAFETLLTCEYHTNVE